MLVGRWVFERNKSISSSDSICNWRNDCWLGGIFRSGVGHVAGNPIPVEILKEIKLTEHIK